MPMRSRYRSTSGLVTNLSCFLASRRNSRPSRVSSSSVGALMVGRGERKEPQATTNNEITSTEEQHFCQLLTRLWVTITVQVYCLGYDPSIATKPFQIS